MTKFKVWEVPFSPAKELINTHRRASSFLKEHYLKGKRCYPLAQIQLLRSRAILRQPGYQGQQYYLIHQHLQLIPSIKTRGLKKNYIVQHSQCHKGGDLGVMRIWEEATWNIRPRSSVTGEVGYHRKVTVTCTGGALPLASGPAETWLLSSLPQHP